ncbi:MAG: hypothetical protein V1824_01015 [archaeon]
MKSKQEGYVFLIASVIIIALISGLFILSKSNFAKADNSNDNLSQNYIAEFNILTTDSALDINSVENFNLSFEDFILSHNKNIKSCNIIDDGVEYIYLSNYLGETCGIYYDDVFDSNLQANSTIQIDRFINKTNIYLCNCIYQDSSVYYMELYDSKVKSIYKN